MTKKRISDAKLKLCNDISALADRLKKLEEKKVALLIKISVTNRKLYGLRELVLKDDLADNYGKPVICSRADECGSYSCPHGRIHICGETCIRYCSESEEQGFNDEICIPVTRPKKVKHDKV